MIMNPTAIKHVVVDGHSLPLESFVAIARYYATVELAPSALEAMKKSRALAEKIAAEGRVAYGITTGFGEFQKVAVPKEMSNQLSTNLILSHCTAAGEPYADEIVRGMMLLRANALCGGVSGVRPILVEMLLEMLNKGVTPVVPQKGSLGSSGDLAPLAHMALPMLGKGEAMYEGVKMPGAEAMAKAGIKTLDTLVSKEGLGMTNGTCAMTSVGALALYDTICAAQLGDVIASMSFEGLTGLRNAFDPRIHQVRGQKGQMLVAANMRKLHDASAIHANNNKAPEQAANGYVASLLPNAEQIGWIAGALAGLMTESGKLGFIGGMELDTTKGKIAGFEAAAKYVGEQEGKTVELLAVPYANSFSDAPKGKEFATELISQGADVFFGDASAVDSGAREAIDAANEKAGAIKIYDIGQPADILGQNPCIICSQVTDNAAMIGVCMEAVVAGTFGGNTIFGTLENGALSAGAINTELGPAEKVEKYNAYLQQMMDGTFMK